MDMDKEKIKKNNERYRIMTKTKDITVALLKIEEFKAHFLIWSMHVKRIENDLHWKDNK